MSLARATNAVARSQRDGFAAPRQRLDHLVKRAANADAPGRVGLAEIQIGVDRQADEGASIDDEQVSNRSVRRASGAAPVPQFQPDGTIRDGALHGSGEPAIRGCHGPGRGCIGAID